MKTNPQHYVSPISMDNHPDARGLTKREYFAAMAMQGLLASFTEKAAIGAWGSELDLVAKTSTELSDALINALNKSNA